MSENNVELDVMEPQYGFYEVTIEIEQEDSETGKVKKVKEVHLIDAINVSECEAKAAQEMKGTMWEWKISQVRQSKINFVY